MASNVKITPSTTLESVFNIFLDGKKVGVIDNDRLRLQVSIHILDVLRIADYMRNSWWSE